MLIPVDENYLEENQMVEEFNIEPIDDSVRQIRRKTISGVSDTYDEKKTDIQNSPVLLIIDDDEEVRKYIHTSLNTRYRILEADNGVDGFKTAKEKIPDLIISDIKMPKLGGIELCMQLKENVKTSHIPVILLTAYTNSEYRMTSLEKGADAYITKPFNIELLEAQVVNLLQSRGKLIDKYSRELVLGPKKVAVKDIDAEFLKQVTAKIEVHMADSDFNSEFLAREIGLSRMQLYRKLRSLTDQTVHEFIRNIRLKRAVQLLEEKKMTITEVAYEVGFNDLTYFARCFRKQYNKSPSEYISRKKN